MYLNFYQLEREPFHVTPDPEFWFASRTHMEALSAIIYGIEQRKGFIAVTGEVGLGKTTIVRNYLEQSKQSTMRVIYIYDSDISFGDLLTTIFQELGMGQRPKNLTKAVRELYKQLIVSYRLEETVVLIIDEAQNLPIATLERLRMLSNLETAKDKLIQLVLIGQPEFNTLLEDKRLRQLKQRIAIRAEIAPLGQNESVKYLKHRLAKVSFGPGSVMDLQAMRMIAQAAQGVPRRLNILGDNALITGFGYAKRPVTGRIAREVIHDQSAIGATRPRRRVSPGAIAAGVLVAISLAIPLSELVGVRLSPLLDRVFATMTVPALTEAVEGAESWWWSDSEADLERVMPTYTGNGSNAAAWIATYGACEPRFPGDRWDCEVRTPIVRQSAVER